MRILAPILALLATASSAQDGPLASDWIAANTQHPLDEKVVGTWINREGIILGVDPLGYFGATNPDRFDVPHSPAQFIVYLDPTTGRVSKAALIYANAPVTCGVDRTTVGTSTSMAVFLSPRSADVLRQYIASYRSDDSSLYEDWIEAHFGQTYPHFGFIDLPGFGPIPLTDTGWGDGGYPMASLHGADGTLLAVYMDFMGKDEDGNWLLPEECGNL